MTTLCSFSVSHRFLSAQMVWVHQMTLLWQVGSFIYVLSILPTNPIEQFEHISVCFFTAS